MAGLGLNLNRSRHKGSPIEQQDTVLKDMNLELGELSDS